MWHHPIHGSFTSKDFRFTINGNALFITAMAWSDDGTFVVHSVNSTTGVGKHVSGVSLVGSTEKVSYTVGADGLHIGPVSQPSSVKHAFVFRAHLDGSRVGFVTWDLLDEQTPVIVPGAVCRLQWRSGGSVDDRVSIDVWTGTVWATVVDRIPNTGRYAWRVPDPLLVSGEPVLRIRVVDEPNLSHVASFPLARHA